jgi:hypothetical protein
LLAASSASSIRRGGHASPPPCRFDIIFDLEMVLSPFVKESFKKTVIGCPVEIGIVGISDE